MAGPVYVGRGHSTDEGVCIPQVSTGSYLTLHMSQVPRYALWFERIGYWPPEG